MQSLISVSPDYVVAGERTHYTLNVANNFYGLAGKSIGLLPPALRWVSPDGQYIIAERPPQLATIQFREARRGDTRVSLVAYTIPIPWTVYAIKLHQNVFSHLRVFARTSPIVSERDQLFHLCLPNISLGTGEVCTGQIYAEKDFSKYDLAAIVQEILTGFWDSEFNHDLELAHICDRVPEEMKDHPSVRMRRHGYISTAYLQEWERKTLQEVMQWHFRPAKYTIGSLVETYEKALGSKSLTEFLVGHFDK
ncbi:MAG TPA: hypothetical protein VJ742_13225 [Nitrososphaera sp.]|nr:hypothetical protein [Nitrososphaera sp.]